jgi:hypothetical protein
MKKFPLYLIFLLFPLSVIADYIGWNLFFAKAYGYRSPLQCLKEDCATMIKMCEAAGVEDYKQTS